MSELEIRQRCAGCDNTVVFRQSINSFLSSNLFTNLQIFEAVNKRIQLKIEAREEILKDIIRQEQQIIRQKHKIELEIDRLQRQKIEDI